MKIEILGTGCKKCNDLEKSVREAAEQFDIAIEIEKVSHITKIIELGVVLTPGLVIDGNVVSSGKTHKAKEIVEMIKGKL